VGAKSRATFRNGGELVVTAAAAAPGRAREPPDDAVHDDEVIVLPQTDGGPGSGGNGPPAADRPCFRPSVGAVSTSVWGDAITTDLDRSRSSASESPGRGSVPPSPAGEAALALVSWKTNGVRVMASRPALAGRAQNQ
jgi:hypothetical protein